MEDAPMSLFISSNCLPFLLTGSTPYRTAAPDNLKKKETGDTYRIIDSAPLPRSDLVISADLQMPIAEYGSGIQPKLSIRSHNQLSAVANAGSGTTSCIARSAFRRMSDHRSSEQDSPCDRIPRSSLRGDITKRIYGDIAQSSKYVPQIETDQTYATSWDLSMPWSFEKYEDETNTTVWKDSTCI
ncbi:hypothetical protein AXG93_1054s1030 [Marchantia polymorpha subsp. ruderalis]|uniref:Uncharacterized protein n=1 Tax=Marchantia polymorpha subsp. ruderalis TaxID=1480154 RepID=A0A176WMN2_MARPO|nr:hypothetical protein AXG93_1054s1030 [Marchantia polymorpha subsp. ruderalis]